MTNTNIPSNQILRPNDLARAIVDAREKLNFALATFTDAICKPIDQAINAFPPTESSLDKLPKSPADILSGLNFGDGKLSDLNLLQLGSNCLYFIKQARELAFAGVTNNAPIDVGVGSSALNRNTKRLTIAIENLAYFEREFSDKIINFISEFPDLDFLSTRLALRALFGLRVWDPESYDNNEPQIKNCIIKSIQEKQKISFVFFICPPVNYGLMQTSPNNYLLEDFEYSLLSRQIDSLGKILTLVEALQLPVEITAIIGDQDEESYIWPVIGTPSGINPNIIENRRTALVESAYEYLTRARVRAKKESAQATINPLNLKVLSLDAMMKQNPLQPDADIMSLVRSEDIDQEVGRMRDLWKPGKYYDGLEEPDDVKLREIVELKFKSYAEQGLMLSKTTPNAILIQTELPRLLRTSMLNYSRIATATPPLPAINLE